MLKPVDALLQSDPRFRDYVFREDATGETRPMGMDDLRRMVVNIELNARIPAAVREQFDIARNAFVYSWFVYEFSTLAEQQCYATLEMALRHRLDPTAPANTTRSPGLHKLLKIAVEHGWLRRENFFVAPLVPGAGEPPCMLDFIAPSRNHVMHGNVQLLPQGTTDILRLCADVMEKLFSGAPVGA